MTNHTSSKGFWGKTPGKRLFYYSGSKYSIALVFGFLYNTKEYRQRKKSAQESLSFLIYSKSLVNQYIRDFILKRTKKTSGRQYRVIS
jgi:hypothetical protein